MADSENRTFIFPNPGYFLPPDLISKYGQTQEKVNESTPGNITFTEFPMFCGDSVRTYTRCKDTPLNQCDECDMSIASVFMALVAFLGLAIVIGNLLVLLVVRKRKVKGRLENMDLHRTSLAAADILTGVQILVITTYNFSWSIQSSSGLIAEKSEEMKNTSSAFIGGIFFTLTFSSSIYNLTFLAGQRLYAFARPIDYKLQRKRTISLWIFVVWVLAVVSSTACAWFPDHFTFTYTTNTFLFYPNIQPGSAAASLGLLAVTLVLPYVLTTSFLIASAVIVHAHLKRSAMSRKIYRQSAGGQDDDSSKSNEMGFFVTTALMQVGFTFSVVPCAVVVILGYADPTFSASHDGNLAYAVCLYISMLNSLVNVLVYSIRDSKFRFEVRKVVASYFCCCCSSEFGKGTIRKLRAASEKKILPNGSSATNSTGTTGTSGTDGHFAKKFHSSST